VGAVTGGILAQRLLTTHDWRSVFYLGATATAILIPIVFFVVPESVHWLAQKQPAGALENINKTMRQLGQSTFSALPRMAMSARQQSFADIFNAGLFPLTILVTFAYFFHITTFYYL